MFEALGIFENHLVNDFRSTFMDEMASMEMFKYWTIR